MVAEASSSEGTTLGCICRRRRQILRSREGKPRQGKHHHVGWGLEDSHRARWMVSLGRRIVSHGGVLFSDGYHLAPFTFAGSLSAHKDLAPQNGPNTINQRSYCLPLLPVPPRELHGGKTSTGGAFANVVVQGSPFRIHFLHAVFEIERLGPNSLRDSTNVHSDVKFAIV